MIELPIAIKLSHAPQRAVSAIWLEGHQPKNWFELLEQGDIPLDSLRFLPVPESRSSQTALGAICLLNGELSRSIASRFPGYGWIAEKLLVPIEAEFSYSLNESEWRELGPIDSTLWVWHPRLGLLAFEIEQQLRAADLCLGVRRQEVNWSLARSGSVINTRLKSLHAPPPLSIEELLERERGDIGSRPDQLTKLANDAPRTISSTLKQFRESLDVGMGSVAEGLIRFLPSNTGKQGTLHEMREFLERLVQKKQEIENDRQNEIQRLLKELEENPDEGLKYALPLHGPEGRGIAPPSRQLGVRNVDYRFQGSSSGPSDSWIVSNTQQQQLIAKYRQAAEREQRLGRFRRAAYVYASLLGDYLSAAKALEAGKFYSEAAVLYQEKCKIPFEAARCFEQGGMFPEAIEVYTKLGLHLKAADLHEKLGDTEQAHACFHLGIKQLTERNDWLGAAEIYELRLKSVEDALETLERGWPHTSQAARCLVRFLNLASNQPNRIRLSQKLDELTTSTLTAAHQLKAIDVVSQFAMVQQDKKLEAHAADCTRRLASSYFVNNEFTRSKLDTAQVVASLCRLTPHDKVLALDGERFVERIAGDRINAKPEKQLTRTKSQKSRRLELQRTISVPRQINWRSALSVGTRFYLAGISGNEVHLIRGKWEVPASLVRITWTIKETPDENCRILLAEQLLRNWLTVSIPHSPPLTPQPLPASDDFHETLTAGTPGFLTRDDVAIGVGTQGVVTLKPSGTITQFENGELFFTIERSDQGAIIESDTNLGTLAFSPVVLTRDRLSYFSSGPLLYRLEGSNKRLIAELPSSITHIHGTPPHTRLRLLVTHEEGISLVLPEFSGVQVHSIETQTPDCVGCLLPRARLVIWVPVGSDNGELRLYEFTESQLILLSSHSIAGPKPVAILPGSQSNEFAVLPGAFASLVRIYQTPD